MIKQAKRVIRIKFLIPLIQMIKPIANIGRRFEMLLIEILN